MGQREFRPGDVVIHRNWGVGLITAVDSSTSLGIKIDFKYKPQHQMSLYLAQSNLTILPADGLEALFIKYPERLANWGEEAPFKLIGAALADINRPTKPLEIRNRIENKHILKMSWGNWWKRVQPVIRELPQFRRNSKGFYELVASLEQIPTVPLPSAPQKKKKEAVDSTTAKEIAAKVLAGEVNLGDIKGAEVLKPVLKELFRKNAPVQQASAACLKVVDGPVVNIRMVLERLNKAKRPSELIRVLEQIVSSVRNLYTAGGQDIEEKKRGHFIAKIGLVEDGVKKILDDPVSPELVSEIIALTELLLDFALNFWQENTSKWRADLLSGILSAVAILGQNNLQVRQTIGTFISAYASGASTKIGVAEELIKKFGDAEKTVFENELLDAAVKLSPQFAKLYFSRIVVDRKQPGWILDFLGNLFPNQTLESLLEIFKKNRDILRQQNLIEYVELVAGLAATSSLLGSSASYSFSSELESTLIDALINKQTGPEDEATGTLGLISKVIDAKLRAETELALHVRNEMESEIRTLQEEQEEERGRVAKQHEEIKRLQSGYRIPEKWATFHGKKEIAEGLAELYQEALLSRGPGIDTGTRRWLLLRIEILFQRNGINLLGKVGDKEKYNPSLHEFTADKSKIAETVIIVCPGFEWEDPNGNRIILSRARVSNYGG